MRFHSFMVALTLIACSAEQPSGRGNPALAGDPRADGALQDVAAGGAGSSTTGQDGIAGADEGDGSGDQGAVDPPGGVVTGDGSCGTGSTASDEVCGNGLDDDLNGFIDENCPCTGGSTQSCFGGDPAEADLPNCQLGTQSCQALGEFGGWGPCEGWSCDDVPPAVEICDSGLDEDCDGRVDEGCLLTVPVNIDGDCLEAACPPQAPFPVGCDIVMSGNDPRGCVASTPDNSTVYFQEGNACPIGLPFEDAGHVGGTLLCATQQGPPLDATTCAINKPEPSYPTDRSGCAPT